MKIDATDKNSHWPKKEESQPFALQNIVDAFPQSIIVFDEMLKFVLCNDLFRAMLGREASSMLVVGTSASAILVQLLDQLDNADAFLERVIKSDVPYKLFQNNGGTIKVSIKPISTGGYLFTFEERILEGESEETARSMLLDAFEALDDGLVLCNEKMQFIFANKAWFNMFYAGRENMMSRHGDNVLEKFTELVYDDFYAIPDNMSYNDYIEWQMMEMAEHEKQVPIATADGRKFIGSSHLTAFGGSLLVIRDVTERLQLSKELEQQREASHQNEKLSALGELLAGVAHELNNPLSIIFGYSQMLQGKVEDPILTERIDLICQSAERAAKIVRTFLAMARQRPMKVKLCSINEIVTTALEVSSYELQASGSHLLTELENNLPLISGDFDQLAQVFSNLITNAGYAIKDLGYQGKLVVRSFYDNEKNQTVVEIHDNGPGIPKDIQKRIFEPFFTTKEVGEGTGIGLAFSHRIVNGHNGVLDICSSAEKSTSFFVRLKAEKDVICNMPKPLEDKILGGVKSILIVDDEKGVAQLLHDILTASEFDVTTTTSAQKALNILETSNFDIILSDFKMPGLNGSDFYKSLKIVSPKQAKHMGFITGDAMNIDAMKFFEETNRPYIEKPIIKSELIALINLITGNID